MRGRSLFKWVSRLLQPAEPKKEGFLPDTPPPSYEEEFLPGTPPPSYEEACSGLPGASSRPRAVAGAPRPQNPRFLKIVDEAVAQADDELRRLKQLDDSLDIVDISSRIRQLCDSAACRVIAHRRRLPNANLAERRQETITEIARLFESVFESVDWNSQDGIGVVRVATCAFKRTTCRILDDIEHRNYQAHNLVLVRYRNYWQARAGLHVMLAAVFRTAGSLVERLAGDEVVARSFVVVADSDANFAVGCIAVANL